MSKAGARARAALVATAVAAVGVLVSASPAFAGTCGQTKNPTVDGGAASWTLSCGNGKITMAGWVKDTDADGKCAYVKGIFNNNILHQTSGACPKNTKINFSWTEAGTIVDGYLFTVNA